VNFCTIDNAGRIVDRRAGRIDSATNRRLAEKLRAEIRLPNDVEFFFETEADYRGVLVLRGDELSEQVATPTLSGLGCRRLTRYRSSRWPAHSRSLAVISYPGASGASGGTAGKYAVIAGYAKLMPYRSLRNALA